jgi:hypothetical protein
MRPRWLQKVVTRISLNGPRGFRDSVAENPFSRFSRGCEDLS